MSLTAKQLRDVAWALDKLTVLTRCVLEPLAAMDAMNAAEATVEVVLTNGDRPMTSEEARKVLRWVDGDDMQRDLRAAADAIEPVTSNGEPVAPAAGRIGLEERP